MSTPTNHLIQRLPKPEKLALLAACESVELKLSEVVAEAGQPIKFVYFPTTSFISLLTQTPGHTELEVSMVGREGMLGAHLALGVPTSLLKAFVQGEGHAWRISAAHFKAELKRSPTLAQQSLRYAYVLMGQLASSAACVHHHQISQRLARWLLMSQDRAQSRSFHVTHEFLAHMLGVRRVGVTTAAGPLQKQGLISYQRGELTVLDRPGLEAASCTCYAADQAAYAQQLGGRAKAGV